MQMTKKKRPKITLVKNKVQGFRLPDFNTCHKARVIRVVWVLLKMGTAMGQTRHPELDSHVFFQSTKAILWLQGGLINKSCWKNWVPRVKI